MIKQYELKQSLNTKGKVHVGVPRERLYIPYFVDNRDQILMTLQKAGRSAGLYQHSGHRVDRNRDSIVEHFLNLPSKPEWLQMLDSDMDHPHSISLRLAAWGKPIVGGLYFHRARSHDPFVFKEAEPGKDKYGRTVKLWSPLRDEVYQFLTENNIPMGDGALTIDDTLHSPLVECDAVATGAILIHRSVLELMKKPIFEYREGGNSEDMIFCYEAKHNYGIPVHCDLSTISGHYIFSPQGQTQFRFKYLQRGVALTGYSKREITEMLSEFLGISKEVAGEKIQSGNAHMVGDYWESLYVDKKPSDIEVKKFYEDPYTGRLYLIELIHWNFTPTFRKIKTMFTDLRDMKVLEIGSGIGSLAIQLAIQKCDVTASEVNNILKEFSEYRVKYIKEKIRTELGNLKFVRGQWKSEPKNTYDAVVSVDTFEHLTESQVKRALKDISRVIKPGGNLIYHANFAQQGLYPMHFDHSEMWDTWLVEAGFIPINPTHAIKGYENGLDSEPK